MVGITSFGTYIPAGRLGQGTAGWTSRTERSVASYDEDAITMATAALIDCLSGVERSEVDALFVATTTAPYLEKQAAVIVAEAADLRTDIQTADVTNSLRAGTQALKAAVNAVKAGDCRQAAVCAADLRLPQARSEFEPTVGDGAVAITVGSDRVLVVIEESYSVSHDILDVWRSADDPYLRSSEDRFATEEGILRVIPLAVRTLLQRCGLTPQDFARAVITAPDAKKHNQLAAALGFSRAQADDWLLTKVGNTGSALALMLLAAAVAESKPGDRILLANYGDGVDVLILRVTEAAAEIAVRPGLKQHATRTRVLPDYLTYARWRGLIDAAPPVRRPPLDAPSPAALFRERDQNIRLYGARCLKCGYEQYPPQRVCTRCHSRDEFQPVRFAQKPATLFTYSLDYLGPTPDPPMVVCFVNFEGGGRMQCLMADADTAQVQVGMPVAMTFRRLHTVSGIHNYYWKCIPESR